MVEYEQSAEPSRAPLQLWGGVECSVVQVGPVCRDQVRETGHHERLDDLDRIAALGIQTLRYPVLWERCAPGPAHAGWAWHDQRLNRMRALGITPIVGLLHHGAGPPGTDPLSPEWPTQFAAHAGAVARRYPWVRDWTPVNEPLTTARFGGLYGHWHPHAASQEAFHRLLFNQCQGTLLAMRAIRARIPDARLVQTEDLGRVFSTPPLRYQADHDNGRRWLSLDLLCGRVGRGHPSVEPFGRAGVSLAQLDAFGTLEAAPDIVGINHYVTSDRFLDHRVELYPPLMHGGNARHRYVDTEAARMDLPADEIGWEPRLREAWERYQRPVAITEAHLACADEQEPPRWLLEAWSAAQALRAEGADVRAVTAWSLFGAYDWDSMLCTNRSRYETGVWDARVDPPRPTPLAATVEQLALRGQPDLLPGEGWWRRPERLHAAARAGRP